MGLCTGLCIHDFWHWVNPTTSNVISHDEVYTINRKMVSDSYQEGTGNQPRFDMDMVKMCRYEIHFTGDDVGAQATCDSPGL